MPVPIVQQPDDILTREIPLPQLGQAGVSIAHLSNAYLPTIQSQAQALAQMQAYIETLTATCEQLQLQNTALKDRLKALEADKVNGVVGDLVGAKK